MRREKVGENWNFTFSEKELKVLEDFFLKLEFYELEEAPDVVEDGKLMVGVQLGECDPTLEIIKDCFLGLKLFADLPF